VSDVSQKLNSYHHWREAILLTYPTIIYLPYDAPMPDISSWIKITHIDCQWHISRYNVFDFQLGYDFFFRQLKDASWFKLVWGGSVERRPPDQYSLFYL
jgi:hypothetical protein